MFCPKCGKQLEDGSSFCGYCGHSMRNDSAPAPKASVKPNPSAAPAPAEPAAPVSFVAPNAPVASSENVSLVTPERTAPKKEKKAPKEKKAKKSKKKLIPVFILLFLVAIVAVVAILIFPLKVTLTEPADTETTTGVLADASVTISSNQPIREVSYAMARDGEPAIEDYQIAVTEGSFFKKTLSLQNLKVEPGDTELYVHVKTLFGEYTETFDLSCNVGNIRVPTAYEIVQYSESTQIVENELLIIFDENISEKEARKKISSWGGEVVGNIYILNLYQVHFDTYSVSYLEDKLEYILEEDGVAAASFNTVYPDEEIIIEATPNDSEYDSWKVNEPGGNNWHHECIDAPGAWDHADKLATIKAGVLDGSIDYDHKDIQVSPSKYYLLSSDSGSTPKSFNKTLEEHEDDCSGYDCSFCGLLDHGTHVSGIIGAISNNNKGVCGVAWNSDLYFSNAWITNDSLSWICGTTSNYLYSITCLAMSDCRVINMSLGTYESSTPDSGEEWESDFVEETFKKLENAGYDFLLVKSAGNKNDDASNYRLNRVLAGSDTCRDHMIMVAAIKSTSADLTPFNLFPTQYSVANYSNFGALVDIAAPGSSIYSTINDGYKNLSGTSMATPVVAGVATMVYGAKPGLTAPEVKEILTAQVTKYTSKGGRTYPIVNAHLAVEHALGISENKPVPVPEVGFITGIVQNAHNGDVISDALVTAVNNETKEQIIADVTEIGEYYLYANAGTYTMTFQAFGYITETIYNVKVEKGLVRYNVRLNLISDENDGKGIASGNIINAFDASRIPGAKIVIYRGIDSSEGEVVTTVYSDEDGYYEVELDPGNYTLRVSATDYTPASTSILVIGDETRSNQNCSLSPVLKEGEIRAVLTWGQYPSDLDSHLVGPTPEGGKFHIYYKQYNYDYNGVRYDNLDVDDTTSYGPETTSVYVGVSQGQYTYYVHDFTNRSSSYSNEMSTSEAVVTVYIGGRAEPYVFNVPTESGTLWTVFSVKNGVLTPINTMSYESDEDNVGDNATGIYFTPSYVTVPVFTDKTEDFIKSSDAYNRNFTFTYTYEASDTVERGGVISQSVTANESVMQGTTIELVISTGKPETTETTESSELLDILVNNEWYHNIQDYYTFTFNESGSCIARCGDFDETYSYVVNGDTLTLILDPGIEIDLKLVTKNDNYDWEEDGFFYDTQYGDIGENEKFFYQTDYEDRGAISSNVYWLRIK